LSTHEQSLDEQVYKGCRLPADQKWRKQVQEYTLKVANCLAKHGVIGHFSTDYLVASTDGDNKYSVFACEINLRMGGTTTSLMTMKHLVGGNYDSQTGKYMSNRGEQKYYFATDNLVKTWLVGLRPIDLISILAASDFNWDPKKQVGTVMHLMGATSRFGKLGLTCIANSSKDAQAMYDNVIKLLQRATQDCIP